MAYINQQLVKFKKILETAILSDGLHGKESIIRSSSLINLIHDSVKYDLIESGVNKDNIFPHINETKPELKIAGFLKQKNQDVCVAPSNIEKSPRNINWGPLVNENIVDQYGAEFTKNTLVINVRSQMSSIAKNTDTLFERTFAEALNLHMSHPEMVLGEVYMIPVYEYDESSMNDKRVSFKKHKTNVAKYISFFSSINDRKSITEDLYKYERCALIIVDFVPEIPVIYDSTEQLIEDGLLPKSFNIELNNLSFSTFSKDILSTYSNRFNINNLK